jgi:acyl carrier protein
VINQEAVRVAMKKVGVKVDVDAIGIDTPFVDAGLDSLDIYDLLLELQESLGKEVPDQDIEKLTTISKVVSYFS